MSKPVLVGLVVLGAGAASGFVADNPYGLLCASACLIIGVVLVTSIPKRAKTQFLVLIKDVHARPQRGGEARTVHDPEADLEFDVFLHCWLVNETAETSARIQDLQLSLRTSDGSAKVGRRVGGDLAGWYFQKIKEERDVWDTPIQVVQEQLPELNTGGLFDCGVARQGWLHFRLRDVAPSDLRAGSMTISLKDSFSNTHAALAHVPCHLPGRILPVTQEPAA